MSRCPSSIATACRSLPARVRREIVHAARRNREWRTRCHLATLRRKLWLLKPGSKVRCLSDVIHINDALNFYILYKDIFVRKIYHFEPQRPDPLILDCGSNIGMSILYFKPAYPKSRVIGFEPDPSIFPYLKENVEHASL